MKHISLFFLIAVAVLLLGCKSSQPYAADQTSDLQDVEGFNQDLTGLDTLEEELDTSDLDGLEDDLDLDF